MTPSPVDDLTALAAEFNRSHPAVLRAGSAIVDWVRDLPKPAPSMTGETAALLLGLRVEHTPSLDAGAWQVLDQYGAILADGRVGEPGENVMWMPGHGFLTYPGIPDVPEGWNP